MACSDETLTFGPVPCWTQKNAAWLVHPVSPAIPMARVRFARAAIEMREDSGSTQLRVGFRYSDDGITWTVGAAPLSPTRTTEGISYPTAWVDLTAIQAQLIQFTIESSNEAGTVLEVAAGTARVNIREA